MAHAGAAPDSCSLAFESSLVCYRPLAKLRRRGGFLQVPAALAQIYARTGRPEAPRSDPGA